MPDIKQYSTGRIGNAYPTHENTDHINTKGLDTRGLPGIEAFIDEDIVRAYDDNRPLVNLLSNDEMLNRSADSGVKSFGYGAYLRNNNDDWRLTIGAESYYSDPEDFTKQVTVTPLQVAKGVAYAPDSGIISTGYKKIAGFKRDDGTSLWVDEHEWYYNTNITLDDPEISYAGYYRPVYVELPESALPENFVDYLVNVRQLTSTGAIYTYPIYLQEDLIIPFKSSTFTVEDEQVDFVSSGYPGYDFYPESFVQLESSGLGVLEISEDAEVVKYLKKEEHKLLASQFNSEAGAFTSELKSNIFRDSKSANINRIENDVNFIRSMSSIKAYNGSSRVYFSDFKDLFGVLQSLKDSRHFLGSQELSFEIAFVDTPGDQYSNFKVVKLTSPETRGFQDFGINIADPDAALSIADNTYKFGIQLNNDASPTTVEVAVVTTDSLRDIRDKVNAEFNTNSIYAYARVWDDSNWELRIYSKSSGDYSKVLLSAGTPDLGVALGSGGYDIPDDGQTDWEIFYDESSPGYYYAERTGSSTVHNDFDPEDVGYKLFNALIISGFDNFIVGIDTTTSSSHSCELYIEPSTAHTQGYQELGMNVPNTGADSGLLPLSEYYFKLNIDGQGVTEYSVVTTIDVTYSGVVNAINDVLGGRALLTFTGTNDIKISSDSYGPTSSIETADGTTGNSLFGFAYPAAGFPPAAQHLTPVVGTGKLIYIRPRTIDSFAIFEDSVTERVAYAHSDSILFVVPDTETDIRDYVDTEHAYITETSADRWSTHNDRVIQISLDGHVSWQANAVITKVSTITTNGVQYLLVGNDYGQIFFYDDTGDLYDDDLDPDDFTLFTSGSLGQDTEKINNFFLYDGGSKKYLFILADSFVYHSDVTSGLTAGQTFTAIDTSSSSDVPNVSDEIFSQINDVIDWDVEVDSSNTNKYLIFVGVSNDSSTWSYAPILYSLYDDAGFTFEWYADEIYRKEQIDDVTAIEKHNGWMDPEQTYQVFITNNANGPEIWSGNSLNNWQDVGGGGDERFDRFSWTESNLELGKDSLEIDSDLERLNTLGIFDSKIFTGGSRVSDTYSGFYSYGITKLQKYFAIDILENLASSDGEKLFSSVYRGTGANSDPAILVVSEEQDDGRVQIFSQDDLSTVSNWPSDSSFRIFMNGFNVGGIDYDGEYNVVFSGQGKSNLSELVDAINGDDIDNAGFAKAIPISNPLITIDITPVIRARELISYEKFGNTYTEKYKLVIESKVANVGEDGGHTSTEETTQSDCYMTINSPTTGTSVIGSGSDTMEIDPSTTSYANLQLVDWNTAKASQVKRVSSTSLSFSGNTYINISSVLTSGYSLLTGSLRLKANATDEIGWVQGVGRILKTDTVISLNSTTYTFEVQFNENLTPTGAVEVTPVTCPADVAGSLSGTYWLLNSPTEFYYVWYDVDNNSIDPAIPGRVGIEVDIATGNAATTVATNTATAIDIIADFGAVPSGTLVTVTNADEGNVVDATDGNAGVSIGSITQGASSAPIRNFIEIDGSTITDVQDLLDVINASLSGGVASLQAIGGTAEYCDIVITSSYVGDDSSVEIKLASFGTYLFGLIGIDTTLNSAIPGSTVLTTAGSQTFGYTWENADYFVEYDHPDTSQIRIYIPNGTTRLDTGATIWLDFWQWKELTKISAKIGSPPINNIPSAGEWTYNLEEKKIVVGEQPSLAAPEDYVFVDAKIQKVLRLLDLGTTLPTDQTELSDKFHAVEPRNLTNSDISIARALARLSALHYGVLLWSTDTDDSVLADYSFFLPRLDILSVKKDQDEYGNRIHFTKGQPDSETPWVELPLIEQDEKAYLYTTFINSQDYKQNDILSIPWYLSDNLQRGVVYLNGTSQYFKPNNDLTSTRGLTATRGSAPVSKIALNGDYDLVKITDPIGIYNERKRRGAYQEIDASQTIFVDTVAGNDLNNGFTRNSAKLTIQNAIDTASSSRSYIFVQTPVDGSKISSSNFSINRSFKIYLIAEKILSAAIISVQGECYLEGIETLTTLRILTSESITTKYCDFQSIEGDTTPGASVAGHNIETYNSIVRDGYITQTENMTDDISITFDHVYVAESATIFTFNSTTYNSAGENNFVFNNVTNDINSSGNIIECPESTGISIAFSKCLLPSGSSSTFNSDAPIIINQSVAYAISNSGTGSIIANDSQLFSLGDINIVSATGALESIARGYSSDSLALNYINREEDPGAFLEERVLSAIKNDEQHSSNESYLDFENTRTQFRYNIMSDKFSFFMRFKPLLDYQQTGILFDSRYDGDFNYVSGLFNQNAIDFIQIVYDNKTYERNELTADKYSFKFITSNGSFTSISVIGPYFTVSDNTEYNQWHEIGILMYYQDTYNNKYESADIENEDKERKQMVIFTMFDRDIDRAYVLKNEPYEDAGGNEIPTSMWYPENAIGRFFNIGGGWSATWFSTASGKEWSTWSESRYSMIVDDFLVSSDIIPLNILKDFGSKEKIDIKENDFRISRYDDKNAGIILHCDNPHPYSENGLQPYDTVNVSFRQYEGFESHGVAIERASPNLVVDGRMKRGDWFDRSEARVWDDTINWITWGNVSGLDGVLVAIIAEDSGGNLFIKYVDSITGSVDSSVQILSGASLSEVKALVVGSRIIIAYIDGTSQFKFKTYDGTTQGGPYTINAAATSYISICGGHSSSQVAFAYRDNTAALGYAKIMRTDNGAVVTAATSFTAGADITYNAITETTDKDGNLTYTFFYRLTSSSWLNFVMYEEDLTATVFPPDTLVTGEEPIDIKTTTFIDGQIFVKWKDYNVGADSPVKAAYLNREGTELEPPFEVFSTASPDSMTDDFVQQRDFKVLLAAKDRVTGDIHFRLYQEVGTTVDEATNSPYLRDFDESATNRIFLGLPTEGSIAMATTINDGTYDTGNVIELETDIPSRWYKDFTGVYDEFSVSAEKTRTLFGWAYYHRFNHQQSVGETSSYHVASAEEAALIPPWTTYASSDGNFSQTTEAAVHGTKGYTLAYSGTGADVRLTKSGAWGTDKYARFYLKVDKFFSLTGSDPKQIEIARLGTTGGNDLILLLEYNDPLLSGDGKFKLVAKTTAYGTATTATSVIDYSTNHIIEMRYHIDAAGGWEIWSDEVSVLSNATDTSAETGITSFRIGSATATSDTPSSSSKLYFDSIKVDNAYIGAYTAGLGQGEIWQPITVSTASVEHFIGLYYWIVSGSWVMRLEGTALINPIEFTFNLDDDDPYVHETVTQDTVEFVENYEINFNKIRRHVIKFIPDSIGTIDVKLRSTESSVGDQIDEFYIDNIKVEEGAHPTSIEAEQDGYLEYPYAMKSRGSVFLRLIPEFFAVDSGPNHTLFSAYTQNEAGSEYISHELYYDGAVNKFKFYITDLNGTTVQVESDEYGAASTQRQLTDLRSKHNIVCHWDVEADYIDLRIDSEQYINNNIGLGDFSASITTLVGNRKTVDLAADCVYDMIRFGEEPFGCRQVEDFSKKRDPFFHQNKTDIGSVNVKSLSFFGLTSADQFEQTIYTEAVNDSWRLVIDKGNEFASEVTIRHDGEDIIVFGTTGVTIDGSLSVGTLIATTTATINTTDDHLTLRFGFSGSPPTTNDGYFEIERGNLVNSELRWDESHKAWTVNDGTTNKISIDGISIGTWQANDNFNIISNGTGSVKVFTSSSTDAGGGDGTKARTAGTERASFNPDSVIINDPGNDVDFIVESISKPYMLFVNAGSETVIVGRTGGIIPAAAKTDHSANLVVNRAMSIVSSVATYFGTLAVYDDSGNEGGYVGFGSPTASPSYWEIKTVDADEVRISGGDMVFDNSDSGISFLSDRTNSRLAYTADAPNQATGTSIHGVYCYGSMTAYRIYHSIWNDYAEAFEFDKTIVPEPQPGFVYKMTENGIIPTERRADPATIGIYSDTYGQLMGSAGIFDEEHPDGTKLPIGLIGKVKVWVKEWLEIGAPLVSDVGGFATEATEEERRNYPDLIIGKALEASKDVSAKRIWVLIK